MLVLRVQGLIYLNKFSLNSPVPQMSHILTPNYNINHNNYNSNKKMETNKIGQIKSSNSKTNSHFSLIKTKGLKVLKSLKMLVNLTHLVVPLPPSYNNNNNKYFYKDKLFKTVGHVTVTPINYNNSKNNLFSMTKPNFQTIITSIIILKSIIL
jgi:hypothetical protein